MSLFDGFILESKLVKVNHFDILYIEAMGDYLKVITTEQVYITHMTMKSMEELLPVANFIRVQRSSIIALSKITASSGKCIEINEINIPVGNLYREKLEVSLKNIGGSSIRNGIGEGNKSQHTTFYPCKNDSVHEKSTAKRPQKCAFFSVFVFNQAAWHLI